MKKRTWPPSEFKKSRNGMPRNKVVGDLRSELSPSDGEFGVYLETKMRKVSHARRFCNLSRLQLDGGIHVRRDQGETHGHLRRGLKCGQSAVYFSA